MKAQKNFSDKNALPFPLLTDPDASIIKAFGAWGEKKLYGKTHEGILRKTFIFNEKGELVEIIDKVEGRAEEKQSIAINFLQLGTPCEIVAKATGLSFEEVAQVLRNSLTASSVVSV